METELDFYFLKWAMRKASLLIMPGKWQFSHVIHAIQVNQYRPHKEKIQHLGVEVQ